MPIALRAALLTAACIFAGHVHAAPPPAPTPAPPAAARASGAASAAAGQPDAQVFELTVDGQKMVLTPDDPTKTMVTASVMQGGTYLVVAVQDKTLNLSFGVVIGGAPIEPGLLMVGQCGQPGACAIRSRTAVAGTYPKPGVAVDPKETFSAYDYAELGLEPLSLLLDKVEDTQWPGVGRAKRIKGTFTGTLAHVERRSDGHDKLAGPTKHVSGKFDIYAKLH